MNAADGAGPSLVGHLVELRSRLLRGVAGLMLVFVALLPFANRLYAVLAQPLLDKLPAGGQLIAVDVASPFFAPVKLAFFVAVVVAMPWLLYQAWAFVAPGLYSREKRLAWPLLACARVLFYAGRTQEARDYVMRRDPYEAVEVFLLPMIVRLEYALAADDEDELELWSEELEARMVIHEDIDEAFQAALRVAQAHERLGNDPARISAALEHAQVYARRLDARLGEPRYANWLARERESGPSFRVTRSASA